MYYFKEVCTGGWGENMRTKAFIAILLLTAVFQLIPWWLYIVHIEPNIFLEKMAYVMLFFIIILYFITENAYTKKLNITRKRFTITSMILWNVINVIILLGVFHLVNTGVLLPCTSFCLVNGLQYLTFSVLLTLTSFAILLLKLFYYIHINFRASDWKQNMKTKISIEILLLTVVFLLIPWWLFHVFFFTAQLKWIRLVAIPLFTLYGYLKVENKIIKELNINRLVFTIPLLISWNIIGYLLVVLYFFPLLEHRFPCPYLSLCHNGNEYIFFFFAMLGVSLVIFAVNLSHHFQSIKKEKEERNPNQEQHQ